MKQCIYTWRINFRQCRACNGLNAACRCYTPGTEERQPREETVRVSHSRGAHARREDTDGGFVGAFDGSPDEDSREF